MTRPKHHKPRITAARAKQVEWTIRRANRYNWERARDQRAGCLSFDVPVDVVMVNGVHLATRIGNSTRWRRLYTVRES